MISAMGRMPGHGRADGRAADGRLGDRRVEHAPLAEFLEQAAGGAVRAAVEADVLTHDEDARVALHLLARGLDQRLRHR